MTAPQHNSGRNSRERNFCDKLLHANHHTHHSSDMKFLKVGRVAIITRGRYAGKKVRQPALNSLTGEEIP
jgi:hypothetical protein